MRKLKTTAQIAFLLLAIAGLYAGKQTGNNLLSGLGLFCFGPILVLYGIDAFVRKQFGFKARNWDAGTYEMYQGLSAQLWGVYFALLGLLVMAFGAGYALYPGGPGKLWSAVLGTRLGAGIVLGLIGLLIVIDGVIRLLAGTAGHNVDLPAGMGNCLARAVGALTFLFGVALIGVGVIVALAPGIVNDVINAVIAPFK